MQPLAKSKTLPYEGNKPGWDIVSPVGEPTISAEPEPQHKSRDNNKPYSDEMLHRATPKD